MAKLLTYYDLCSISDDKEFLGLSQDEESGSVINTLGRNIFLTIQLSNQQQVNSWTVVDKLTNKVVFDFKSKKYVGVFGYRNLRCWDRNVQDINKIKKIKLSRAIEDLISYDKKDTIVLYKDGTCESLTSSIESRKQNPCVKPILDEQSHKISKIATFKSSVNDNILLTYFVTNLKSNETEFVYFKLDNELFTPLGAIHKFKITRGEQLSTLVGCTVVDGDLYPSLVTIWSDKRLFIMPLREDDSSIIPGHFVAMLNLFKVEQRLTILGISRDCIAIYGANENQEGASLVLYNTRFTVAQSKQFFKVYFNNARLWVIGKHILLAYGQTLACVSFRISKEQLSDMIGTQISNDLSNVIDKECINEENELEEAISFDANRQIKHNENGQMERMGSTETMDKTFKRKSKKSSSEPTETVEHFENDLKSLYRHNVDVEFVHGDYLLSDSIQTKLSSNLNDKLFASEELTLLTNELEKCGASEFEITEKLIPLLIKSSLSTELAVCLQKYTNVSDKMLVKALKYFINLKVLAVEKENVHLLNVVLSCSFNEDLIKGYLRTDLNFTDVLFILNYLAKLLEKADVTLPEQPQSADTFDNDMVLCNWFSTILDAHYQQFVLSKNTNLPKMLEKWKALIDSYLSNVREMKSLSAILYNLVDGKKLGSDKQSSKWYSVEAVKLY